MSRAGDPAEPGVRRRHDHAQRQGAAGQTRRLIRVRSTASRRWRPRPRRETARPCRRRADRTRPARWPDRFACAPRWSTPDRRARREHADRRRVDAGHRALHTGAPPQHFVQPAAAVDELGAEVAEVRNRAAKRSAAQSRESEQHFECAAAGTVCRLRRRRKIDRAALGGFSHHMLRPMRAPFCQPAAHASRQAVIPCLPADGHARCKQCRSTPTCPPEHRWRTCCTC